jgi:hypothetical protein
MAAPMRIAAVLLGSMLFAGCADLSGSDHSVEVIDETAAPAADDKADANDLTTAQRKAALFAIDQICGDTWCSGDYDFSFKKIVCHFSGKGTCTVTMLIWPRQDIKPVPVYWRSCKISGLHGFADVVDTAANGYQSLDPDFYDDMTTCTMKITAKLPPAQI